SRFVALRFQAPGGPALTPTLRVTTDGGPPLLPLAVTRAGSADLRVSVYSIGAGRAHLLGSTQAVIPPGALAWRAASKASNYLDARAETIEGEGPGGVLLESASHDALVSAI